MTYPRHNNSFDVLENSFPWLALFGCRSRNHLADVAGLDRRQNTPTYQDITYFIKKGKVSSTYSSLVTFMISPYKYSTTAWDPKLIGQWIRLPSPHWFNQETLWWWCRGRKKRGSGYHPSTDVITILPLSPLRNVLAYTISYSYA